MSPSGNRHPADIPCPVCGKRIGQRCQDAVLLAPMGAVIARVRSGVVDLYCGRSHGQPSHICPGTLTVRVSA